VPTLFTALDQAHTTTRIGTPRSSPNRMPFIHPPMLPPSSTNDTDVQMDFLHGSTGMGEGDHFLNLYIHPPMMLPEPHLPMLPSDWTGYPTDGVGTGTNRF
jgi:hypothetical protein